MPGENLDAVNDETCAGGPNAPAERVATVGAPATGADGAIPVEPHEPPDSPVMPPAPPFPTFRNTPTLPHQAPGNGYESGRDSRAR